MVLPVVLLLLVGAIAVVSVAVVEAVATVAPWSYLLSHPVSEALEQVVCHQGPSYCSSMLDPP